MFHWCRLTGLLVFRYAMVELPCYITSQAIFEKCFTNFELVSVEYYWRLVRFYCVNELPPFGTPLVFNKPWYFPSPIKNVLENKVQKKKCKLEQKWNSFCRLLKNTTFMGSGSLVGHHSKAPKKYEIISQCTIQLSIKQRHIW